MKKLESEFTHADKRRTLTQLFTAPVAQVNSYKAHRGSVLGDHYHKETTEYFYVVRGVIRYNKEKILTTGDIFVVEPPERHEIRCMTDVTLMSFLTKPFTKQEPDIFR